MELASLMEALFGGDPPLLDRSALRDLHALPEQRYWLLQDLQALLERAALRGPMLVCLDDQHWADSGTAAALRALPSRLRALPIGPSSMYLVNRIAAFDIEVDRSRLFDRDMSEMRLKARVDFAYPYPTAINRATAVPA